MPPSVTPEEKTGAGGVRIDAKPSRFSTKRGYRGLCRRNAPCGRNSEAGMAPRSILRERYREHKQNWAPQESKHRARRVKRATVILFVPRSVAILSTRSYLLYMISHRISTFFCGSGKISPGADKQVGF